MYMMMLQGKYSTKGAQSCTQCSVGLYASETGIIIIIMRRFSSPFAFTRFYFEIQLLK
jgi:hypothetical protein